MIVVEHTEYEACLFWQEWMWVTGWPESGNLGIMNYWLRQGGYTRQAG